MNCLTSATRCTVMSTSWLNGWSLWGASHKGNRGRFTLVTLSSLWKAIAWGCDVDLVDQGLANFCKGPESKECRLVNHPVFARGCILLCHGAQKSPTDKTERNRGGYRPVKLLLWTLKFVFHIVFTCWEIFFFFVFCFLNHLKTILYSWAIEKQEVGGWIWPKGCRLSMGQILKLLEPLSGCKTKNASYHF